ncbi:unnamed protein product [Calypogeia fissa]
MEGKVWARRPVRPLLRREAGRMVGRGSEEVLGLGSSLTLLVHEQGRGRAIVRAIVGWGEPGLRVMQQGQGDAIGAIQRGRDAGGAVRVEGEGEEGEGWRELADGPSAACARGGGHVIGPFGRGRGRSGCRSLGLRRGRRRKEMAMTDDG